MNVVRAVDATSGALLWQYDPEVRAAAGRLRAGWDHNRGIGFWKGKVYAATWDGRLIAIDAQHRQGSVARDARSIPTKPLYITGAPKIFKGKVLIGNGGTENGRRAATSPPTTPRPASRRGASTSSPATRPTASRTRRCAWPPRPGPASGGSTAAAATRGTASPTTPSSISSTSAPATARRGTARSAARAAATTCSCARSSRSIPTPASTAGTTRRRPARPGTSTRTWTSCSPTCRSTDAPRKVILHAPKNGFFYVIDRTNGKLISAEPFTETTWASADRHGDGPAGRGRRRALRARRGDGGADAARRPQLARDVVQPEDGARLLPGHAHHRDVHRQGYRPGDWRSTPWSVGYGVNGQFVTGSSRKDGASRRCRPGIPCGSAWRGKCRWTGCSIRHADHGGQPRVPGARGRNAAGLHGRHRQGSVAARSRARHLGAADHLRRERQAVRGDPRRVGRRIGGPWRPALRGARLGVRRAQALSRRVRARRQGGASRATATDALPRR